MHTASTHTARFFTLSRQRPLPSPKEGCRLLLLFGKVEWKLRSLIKELKRKPVLWAVGGVAGRLFDQTTAAPDVESSKEQTDKRLFSKAP